MAIVVRTAIGPADQKAHDRLDQSVETALTRQGGPPNGLMVHLAYPSDEGFLIVDVWTSEDAFRAWWTDVMEPALADLDLRAGEHDISGRWPVPSPASTEPRHHDRPRTYGLVCPAVWGWITALPSRLSPRSMRMASWPLPKVADAGPPKPPGTVTMRS